MLTHILSNDTKADGSEVGDGKSGVFRVVHEKHLMARIERAELRGPSAATYRKVAKGTF